MSLSRIGAASAAVAITALTGFGLAAPAFAAPGHNCPNPAGKYPPGQRCPLSGQLGDSTPQPGRSEHVHSEGWQGDSDVSTSAHSAPVSLGSLHANSAGVVDGNVVIPLALAHEVGSHSLVLTGFDASGAARTLVLPFTVTAANAAAALGTNNASSASIAGVQLPRTGAEIAGVSAVGIALIGVGGVAVYSGRRRRLTSV